MHLDGWTLLLQGVNFLVLVAILRWALYRPLRRLAEERQARIQAAEDAARAAQAAAESARQAHATALTDLQSQCRDRLDSAERDAERIRQEAKRGAEVQSAELVARTRRALAEERAAALDWLHQESGRIGARFATRVLAAYGAEAATTLTRQRAADALAELPEADRRRLAEAGGKLLIVSACAPDEAERARWQATLLPWIGADAAPQFAVDPAVLGGARLEWPGSRLDLSWAGALRAAAIDWSADEAADVYADR